MYIQKIVMLVAALSIVAFVHGEAQAQLSPAREAAANAEAKKLIDGCWAISKELRDRGSSADIRNGSAKSIGCLHELILDQTEAMFEPRYLSRKVAMARLDKLADSYQKFIWDIHNSHRGCSPTCGTIYHVFHLGSHAGLLEEMLRTMIHKRYEYEIER